VDPEEIDYADFLYIAEVFSAAMWTIAAIIFASARSVKSGDILVAKLTPQGETQLSPEEKSIGARIFGEKAAM